MKTFLIWNLNTIVAEIQSTDETDETEVLENYCNSRNIYDRKYYKATLKNNYYEDNSISYMSNVGIKTHN